MEKSRKKAGKDQIRQDKCVKRMGRVNGMGRVLRKWGIMERYK